MGLLWSHWFMTPFIMSIWVSSTGLAFFLSFLTVFVLWSLLSVASKIEDPFCLGVFSHESSMMHQELDAKFQMLLTAPVQIPCVSTDVMQGISQSESLNLDSNLWTV